MGSVKFGFNLIYLVSLFNLGLCLECPTCMNEECSTPFNSKTVVLMDCSQGTELPIGFRYSNERQNVLDSTPSYKCLSMTYHFDSNDIGDKDSKMFQQCIDTRADDCSDIVVDLPGNIIIDDCDVVDGGDLVLQTTTTEAATLDTSDVTTISTTVDDGDDDDEEETSTTESTTTTEDPGSASSISLSIALIVLMLVSYLLS